MPCSYNRKDEMSPLVHTRMLYVRDHTRQDIEQILYFSRLGATHKDYSFESLSILGTCREAVEDNLTLLEEAGFSIEYTENDYQVISDKKGLMFILGQIISNVDHQLLRSAETGYYIETPKTKSGIRQIPMSEKVYEAFNRVLKRRRGAKAVTIDGYSNFLFLNRDGYPKTATNYDGMFRGLAKKYNKYHEEALPKVMTPHTLRHTFCTNMANAGMNPKALQYIMGHSNITMTLNYYAHATFDSAKAEMLRIAA